VNPAPASSMDASHKRRGIIADGVSLAGAGGVSDGKLSYFQNTQNGLTTVLVRAAVGPIGSLSTRNDIGAAAVSLVPTLVAAQGDLSG
jgi:hypothetical protein